MTRQRTLTEQSLVTPLQLPQQRRTFSSIGNRLGRIGEGSQVGGGQGGDDLLFALKAGSKGRREPSRMAGERVEVRWVRFTFDGFILRSIGWRCEYREGLRSRSRGHPKDGSTTSQNRIHA